MRGATEAEIDIADYIEDFNPRAPCGARQSVREDKVSTGGISTHAPLAGRDKALKMALNQIYHFNPRAPCGARPDGARLQRQKQYFNPRAPCGARLFVKVFGTDILLFQPTRPLRGATRRERFFMEVLLYFNPRAPCGARPEGGSSFKVDVWISTHAPLAGRDKG